MEYLCIIIIIIVAVVIFEEVVKFAKKHTPSEYEIRRKQDYEDSVVQAKENISKQEKAAKGISDEYINPIIVEIKSVIKKHNSNGFIEVRVDYECVYIDLFDEYGYRKSDKISLRDLKYSPLKYEETIAVAGAIKYRFGKDYVWKRYTGTDDYDGSTFHDSYSNEVKHCNIEQLKNCGIKPF